MKKFNKNIKENQTRVQIDGQTGWHLVTEVHETRRWVKVDGLAGSFQRVHVTKYTNKI